MAHSSRLDYLSDSQYTILQQTYPTKEIINSHMKSQIEYSDRNHTRLSASQAAVWLLQKRAEITRTAT